MGLSLEQKIALPFFSFFPLCTNVHTQQGMYNSKVCSISIVLTQHMYTQQLAPLSCRALRTQLIREETLHVWKREKETEKASVGPTHVLVV